MVGEKEQLVAQSFRSRYNPRMPRSSLEPRPIPALDLAQTHAAAYLNALKREVIPPLLFEGPEGSGKEFAAIEFARALQCEREVTCSLDGSKCPSCLRA